MSVSIVSTVHRRSADPFACNTPENVISPNRHTLAAVAVGAAAGVAAGCGSHARRSGVEAAIATRVRHCTTGARVPLGSPKLSFAAVVRRPTHAYRTPGRRPFAAFGLLNVNRVPTVFSVVGAVVTHTCEPRWYHVELPVKPNGITGWVRAADVRVVGVDTRIDIDLSARRVTFFRRGHVV